MGRMLPEIIADILSRNHAIVDQREDGCMEVISPKSVSEALKLPEFARLNFSSDTACGESIYASYDSDFFSSLSKLFADKGRFSIGGLKNSHLPNIEKLSKTITEKIMFGNATFRFDKNAVQNIPYMLLYFKYSALSDEKHEGIMPVLVNELTLSAAHLEQETPNLIEVDSELDGIERQETGKVVHAGYAVCSCVVKEKLKDFTKSLERRLNRDIKRVYEYYETLKEETKKAINKKSASGERSDVIDKLVNKLDAIKVEEDWKIHDLAAKYALSIRTEPVSAIRIAVQSSVAWINIMRRLSTRRFPVCYNPFIRQFDALPCESCFTPHAPYYVCDDRLHIVCSGCFKTCEECKKQYCGACHSHCPRCKKKGNVKS